MTVQFVDIAGQKMAVLPVADYERLLDAVEDRLDTGSAADAEKRRLAGETYLSIDAVDRILNGESALMVWRESRGLTQSALAAKIGKSPNTVSRLESGDRTGTPKTWRSLAHALDASVDDIMPLDQST